MSHLIQLWKVFPSVQPCVSQTWLQSVYTHPDVVIGWQHINYHVVCMPCIKIILKLIIIFGSTPVFKIGAFPCFSPLLPVKRQTVRLSNQEGPSSARWALPFPVEVNAVVFYDWLKCFHICCCDLHFRTVKNWCPLNNYKCKVLYWTNVKVTHRQVNPTYHFSINIRLTYISRDLITGDVTHKVTYTCTHYMTSPLFSLFLSLRTKQDNYISWQHSEDTAFIKSARHWYYLSNTKLSKSKSEHFIN